MQMDASAVHRIVCGFCTYRKIDRLSTKRRKSMTEVQRGSDSAVTEPRDGFGILLESGHEAVLPSMQKATNRNGNLTRAERTLIALAYSAGGRCCWVLLELPC